PHRFSELLALLLGERGLAKGWPDSLGLAREGGPVLEEGLALLDAGRIGPALLVRCLDPLLARGVACLPSGLARRCRFGLRARVGSLRIGSFIGESARRICQETEHSCGHE